VGTDCQPSLAKGALCQTQVIFNEHLLRKFN
jgi:hypothetical protein